KWGIKFENAYSISEKSERKVQYADSKELEKEILSKYPQSAIPVEFNDDLGKNIASISKKKTPKTRT
ncbi:MAG: hypothetical protein NC452_15490, partial [Eubacterium sp.]|nr:hypothetical protein [Eubacterium sp.]